jgi:hypothetical protein
MADNTFGSGTVKITNNTARDLNIQFYRVNLWTPIKTGDTLTIPVTDAEEVAYYLGLMEASKGATYDKYEGEPSYIVPNGLITVEFTPAQASADDGEGD